MITDVRLQNFRSYTDDLFEFDPGVNIVVGPNASGKTNLLEAILVASIGSSYRAHEQDLIKHNKLWARLDCHTETGERVVKIEAIPGLNRTKKSFLIAGHTYSRLLLHKVQPVVLFEPNHLQLLHGSPDNRRDFLDNLLEQTKPGFGAVRRQHKRALAQRNALLKQDPSISGKQLFAWNIRLSELGGQVATSRLELISTINKLIPKLYRKLSRSKTRIEVTYVSSCDQNNYSSKLLQKLDASKELDYKRGFTAYGPHRDDIQFNLNGHAANEVASRGEIRTILIALKAIELQLLEEVHQKKPILLLDDVFSELDGARRLALTDFLDGYQSFITTTDADVVVQHFMDNCHIIPMP